MNKLEQQQPPRVGQSALTDCLGIFGWEDDNRILHNREVLRVGKWIVGEVCYESRTKGETNNYAAKSMLPGIKEYLDYYETRDEAKGRVERATRKWIADLVVYNATLTRPPGAKLKQSENL